MVWDQGERPTGKVLNRGHVFHWSLSHQLVIIKPRQLEVNYSSPWVELLEEVVEVPDDDALNVRDARVPEQDGDGGKGKRKVKGLNSYQAV